MQNHSGVRPESSVLGLQFRTQGVVNRPGFFQTPNPNTKALKKAAKSTRMARGRFLERGVRERIDVSRRLVQEHHAGLAKIQRRAKKIPGLRSLGPMAYGSHEELGLSCKARGSSGTSSRPSQSLQDCAHPEPSERTLIVTLLAQK